MSRVRAIDASGDWQFGKGRNDYRVNLKEVSQSIRTRLLSFLGDCFFDTRAGIDWFNLLGAKNQLALNLAVSACILNTVGITGIVQISLSLNRSSREITIQYKAQSVYGTVEDTFQYDIAG